MNLDIESLKNCLVVNHGSAKMKNSVEFWYKKSNQMHVFEKNHLKIWRELDKVAKNDPNYHEWKQSF